MQQPADSIRGWLKNLPKLVIPSATRNIALKIKDLKDAPAPKIPRNDSFPRFLNKL
jgi:hypothetical protein